MFLVSKVQESRIRRQERARAKKILHAFALTVDTIQRKHQRKRAIRFVKIGFCEGFETGKVNPGLSTEGFYTKAMKFANDTVDTVMGKKCK